MCLADAEIMNLLIQWGADVNSTNNDQQTPLHRAASMGVISVLNFIFQQNFDFYSLINWNLKSICYVLKGGVPTAELLINARVNINQVDQNDLTPLYLAITNSTNE